MVIFIIITIQTMFYTLRHLLTKLVFHWKKQKKWCSALGLPVIPPIPKHRTPSPIVEVEPQGSGLYVIIPNPQIIDSMSQSSDSMVHRDDKGKEKNISKEFTGYEISTAEYQAWLAGYNSQADS